MKMILSATLALSMLVSFGGQGPAHSGRCRGDVRPPMLGIVSAFGAPPWVCTRAGWRWSVPAFRA